MAEAAPAPNNRLIAFRRKPQRELPRENEFMPWKSDAQRKWGNSPSGHEALGDAGIQEWNEASKGKKLLKRVDKLKKRGVVSDKQHAKLADKWGKDDDGINASSR